MEGREKHDIQATRRSFKQVRYQDERDGSERERERERYNRASEQHQPRTRPQQTQSVLKDTTSRSSANNQPPSRASSLILPTGPTYDPADEEDLKRETSYQQELKTRVESIQRSAENSIIPNLLAEKENKESYDRLDVEADVANLDQEQYRDSFYAVGQHSPQNMLNSRTWNNPDYDHDNSDNYYANQGSPSYNMAPERQDYTVQQMRYTQLDNGGRYVDYYAQQQVHNDNAMHPGRQPHFAGGIYQEQYESGPNQPQFFKNNPEQGMLPMQGYAQTRDSLYFTEPMGYSQELVPVHSQDFIMGGNNTNQNPVFYQDRRPYEQENLNEVEKVSPRAQSKSIELPHKPEYDYVSHNKVDYGFSPKRTYTKIHEVKKDEEEKLTHVFIQPKVRTKSNKNTTSERQSFHPLSSAYDSMEFAGYRSEDMWGQDGAVLDQALVPKPQVGLPVIQPPPYQYTGNAQPVVSRQLITEDGQRISVDVKLRMVSPCPVSVEKDYVPLPITYPQDRRPQYPQVGDSSALVQARNSSQGYSDVYSTNPYQKIPPIGSGSEGSPNSAQLQSNGSYMLSYLKDKEKQTTKVKPWYRIYGLKDYKRMQKELQLGRSTLGPNLDTDTYKEKRDKMLRKMDYAKAVTEKNTKVLGMQKPPSFPRENEQDDIISKRRLAVEYAKNVPKPTVRPKANMHNSYELASKQSSTASPAKPKQATQRKALVEVLNLEKLHDQQQQNKGSPKMIHRKAQGVVS